MKYLIVVTAVLFAGCDLFGFWGPGHGNTITYRLESPDSLSLGPSASVNYLVNGEYEARTGITHFPWEVTVPYFEGPKGFFVSAAYGEATVSILHNGDRIATSQLTSTDDDPPNAIILGTIAHADNYVVQADLSSSTSRIYTNISDLGMIYGKAIFVLSHTVVPGGIIEVSKEAGRGALEVQLVSPLPMPLLVTGGVSPSNVSIQVGASQ